MCWLVIGRRQAILAQFEPKPTPAVTVVRATERRRLELRTPAGNAAHHRLYGGQTGCLSRDGVWKSARLIGALPARILPFVPSLPRSRKRNSFSAAVTRSPYAYVYVGHGCRSIWRCQSMNLASTNMYMYVARRKRASIIQQLGEIPFYLLHSSRTACHPR
jgi:hypothetical protein